MKDAEATLSIMQEMDIPLLVHGESHGFVMDREAEFLDVYRDLATRFPRLTICMEHITTAAAVQLLDEFENLAATARKRPAPAAGKPVPHPHQPPEAPGWA